MRPCVTGAVGAKERGKTLVGCDVSSGSTVEGKAQEGIPVWCFRSATRSPSVADSETVFLLCTVYGAGYKC